VNNNAEPPNTPAGIESLSWMVGGWEGSLGPQTVEATWSTARDGGMNAMIRLSSPEGVLMIELIVIREAEDAADGSSFVLHLRQFSPSLDMVTNQDMQLQAQAAHSISFLADEPATIRELAYNRVAPDHLQVDVTFATGDVFTAHLHPA
jgi:hypothetical protein